MLYHTFTTKIQNSVIVNKFTELCIHHKELLCTFIVMSISTHPQTTTNLLSVSIVFYEVPRYFFGAFPWEDSKLPEGMARDFIFLTFSS